MATKKRRTQAEVHALALEAKKLIDAGSNIQDAIGKVGLEKSVYHAWVKRGGENQVLVQRGKIDAGTLPPRPTRGGKRPPKPVDMNDVASLAVRIARIDKKMASMDDLRNERKPLAERLLQLLKGSTGR